MNIVNSKDIPVAVRNEIPDNSTQDEVGSMMAEKGYSLEEISKVTGLYLAANYASVDRALSAMRICARVEDIPFRVTESLAGAGTFEDFKAKLADNPFEEVKIIGKPIYVAWIAQMCEANGVKNERIPCMYFLFANDLIPLGTAWPERDTDAWWFSLFRNKKIPKKIESGK